MANGGLVCDYTERLWGQENIEEERRKTAIQQIKNAIDNGMAAVVWDISGCEWGIITGYDDEAQILFTLKIDGSEDQITYDKLGKLEIQILSVLTVSNKSDKSVKQIVADTKRLAVSHLRGDEWCDAFDIGKSGNVTNELVKQEISDLLMKAKRAEQKFLDYAG